MELGATQAFASPGEALAHHGIKGMKWGVHKKEDTGGGRMSRGQATKPLSDRKQKRVDKFLNRADVMGTRISDLQRANAALHGSKNPAKLYSQYANNQNIAQLRKEQQRALRDAQSVQKGKLTSTQKRLIVGAILVATVLLAVALMRGHQSGALNQIELLAKQRLHGEKVPFRANPKLARKMSADELLHNVAKPVNPGYSKAGGKMNCRRSTYAYELRRRGFDVHATTSSVGWGQSESGVINAVTPGGRKFYRARSVSQAVVESGGSTVARGDRRVNPLKKIVVDNLHTAGSTDDMNSAAKVVSNIKAGRPIWAGINEANATVSSSKKVLEELAKQPNGARGEVLFKFPSFGHSMAYEIVDGKPHIFDSQKGTLYHAAGKMVESKWDGFTGAEITRLDNAHLDLKFLSRWATNIGGQ